ncbi:MAG: hypothetical protein ACXVDI_26390 [Ktedonobacterales bacterium]
MGTGLNRLLRRRRWPLIAVAALVIVVGGLAVFLATGPLRAGANGGAAKQCGAVHLARETFDGAHRATVSNPDEAGRAGQCFAQAYGRCEPATLTVTRMSVDVSTTETFTLARSGGSCAITDAWSKMVNVHITKTGTEHCAGLTTQADGLLIRGCGTLGDRPVPTQ